VAAILRNSSANLNNNNNNNNVNVNPLTAKLSSAPTSINNGRLSDVGMEVDDADTNCNTPLSLDNSGNGGSNGSNGSDGDVNAMNGNHISADQRLKQPLVTTLTVSRLKGNSSVSNSAHDAVGKITIPFSTLRSVPGAASSGSTSSSAVTGPPSAKEFSCTFCSSAYSSRSALEKHLKNAHAGGNGGGGNGGKRQANQASFQCKFCHSFFHSSPGLTRHINKCHPTENRQVILLQLPVSRPW
jgi:hypothetical protein